MTNITVRGLPQLQRHLSSLGRSLRGVRGKVGNNIKYGPFVGSERFQARVHRNRWPTDERTLRRRLPDIERYFGNAVDGALSADVVTENPLLRPMHQSTLVIQADMSDYPPKPAGSTYRRTGSYGRRWTTQITET